MNGIIIGMAIGILTGIACGYAISVSRYISKVENCDNCLGCLEYGRCFAKKELAGGKTTCLDEWILISYCKVRSYCKYIIKTPLRDYFVCIICGIFVMIPFFWSGQVSFVNVLYGISVLALCVLSVVDWNTQYIPVEMSGIIFICGLIHLGMDLSNWLEYIIGLIAVSGFLLLVNVVATPLLQKKYEEELDSVIGDGDIKLMAATGLLLGWKLNFLALGIGCIAGSVIHLILMKIKKGERIFALGPYLSLGVYITMIYGEQLISWYLEWMGVNPIN
jgi:leader peptidase (prepilin peptidase)/N-methyltransferase